MPTTIDDIQAAQRLREAFGPDRGSCFGVGDASRLRRPHKPMCTSLPQWVDKNDDPILPTCVENESKQRLAD
jgi:hypothetical protein